MMFDRELLLDAADILDLCRQASLRLATVESCTGGLVVAALTAIPGSSDVVQGGITAYSNEAKRRLLGVSGDLLDHHGAVSEPVARAMAEAALQRLDADIAVSATGIAGPGGGSKEKPVGLVHIACAGRNRPTLHVRRLYGDCGRSEIRRLAVLDALALIRAQLGSSTAVA